MHRRTLNLGILAHVDAGKTTLTERLHYAAGVVDAPGSVDEGTTQTDFLALERQRGITISAVVSFAMDGVSVNLIDTPGHPDFIAEVERVLAVLDGAVLVISAVEGVQPQTRILMRALRRLRVPTLVFLNKIDRTGADVERVLVEIRERLTPAVLVMSSAQGEGTRSAEARSLGHGDAGFGERLLVLPTDHDDLLLREYLDDERSLSPVRLREALAVQTTKAHVNPVYCGSALTGAGVEGLAGATGDTPRVQGELARLETELSAARTRDLQLQLAALTHGEGLLDSSFAGDEPVAGDPPARPRTTSNSRDLDEYLAHLAGGGVGSQAKEPRA